MCNMYNTSARSVSNTCFDTTNYGCGRNYNGCNGQFMCRDCNGNIWARNITSCGYNRCGGCGCGCGCFGSTFYNQNENAVVANNTGYGNHGFTCVTFCGNTTATQTQTGSTTTTTNGCGTCNRGCGWNRCGWGRCGCGNTWL